MPFDVEMPDGTIIQDVPDGTTKSELTRRLGLMNRTQEVAPQPGTQQDELPVTPISDIPQEPSMTQGQAFGRNLLTQFVNNAVGVPELAAGLLQRLPDVLAFRQPTEPVNFRPLGLPSANELAAGAQTAIDVPGAVLSGEDANISGRFAQNLAGQQATDLRAEQEFPLTSMAGRATADVGTLLTGRLPIRSAAGKTAPQSTVGRALGREPARAAPRVDELPPGLKRFVREKAESKAARGLGRGVGKAAQTGTEGAVLAILGEGKPAETAALAAGGQAVGSLAQTLARNPLRGLVPAIAASVAAIQLFKVSTPGGRDFITDSSDIAFKETRNILALGALAAASGLGRGSPSLNRNLPKISEALLTTRRGTVLSVVKELIKAEEAGDETTVRVLETFAENPGAFDNETQRRLQRSIMSEKPARLSAEIDRIKKSGF